MKDDRRRDTNEQGCKFRTIGDKGKEEVLLNNEGDPRSRHLLKLSKRDDVTWNEAIKVLDDVIARRRRIDADPHTNEHFELIKGKMWKKGDGTGKYWDYLCSSRTAIRQAHEMMKS